MLTQVFFICLLVRTAIAASLAPPSPKRWDTVTISFKGPSSSETATPNPFTDYRLDVMFENDISGVQYNVPGFYATDGKAGETSSESGNIWMVRFTPGEIGLWRYTVSFRTAPDIASMSSVSSLDSLAVKFHGETSTFEVGEAVADLPDLRARGRLEYFGQRYLRFADGNHFLKLGTNSPETLLSFVDFDGKGSKLHFANHTGDWQEGDPTWGDGKRGKGLIGAINYLSSRGVNSLFAMVMTVKGDSNGQIHPWISREELTRYDVSKLEQWQVVFEHATRKGMSVNLAFLETENEALFEYDEGLSTSNGFALSRKLFYREIIARFGHILGLTLTLGEENGWSETIESGGGHAWGVGNTLMQRRMFTSFLREIDPYDCPLLIHTFPPMKDQIYMPLLGPTSGAQVEGASLQVSRKVSTYWQTQAWIERSERAGKPWVVTTDEIGSEMRGGPGGVPVASMGRMGWQFRAWFCWANALAGGAGIEVYSASVDQSLDDFRELDLAWAEFSRVHFLFEKYDIPFWRMKAAPKVVATRYRRDAKTVQYAFAEEGLVYVVYQSGRTETVLDLSRFHAWFSVRWFNVYADRSTELMLGTVEMVYGGQVVSLGRRPSRWRIDWVAIVKRV